MSRRNLTIVEIMREEHRKSHPHCTYGDEPHYVPPSLGDPGFYLCDARVVPTEDYADPDFQPGMVVADLDGGPDDRRTWECRPQSSGMTWFHIRWVALPGYTHWRQRADLPAHLGVVDPATGRLNR